MAEQSIWKKGRSALRRFGHEFTAGRERARKDRIEAVRDATIVQAELAVPSAEGLIPATQVVGEARRQPAISQISGRRGTEEVHHKCRAQVVWEPENLADPNAAMVLIQGHHVGYLARENAYRYRPVLQVAHGAAIAITCEAMINARGGRGRGTSNAGVILWLPEPEVLMDAIADTIAQKHAAQEEIAAAADPSALLGQIREGTISLEADNR